jgi:transcriptional regulator with XRE-family HTH domain
MIATAFQAERSLFLLAFGRKLRAERKRRNLSQEALAHIASLHRNEIGYLERGEHEPYVSTLLVLADALGLPPCALLDGLPVPVERKPATHLMAAP